MYLSKNISYFRWLAVDWIPGFSGENYGGIYGRQSNNGEVTIYICSNNYAIKPTKSTVSKLFCFLIILILSRSQWPHGLRRRSTAARLQRLWVRIPPGAWVSVCCELSGGGLCDKLITRPEESYRLWCVVVCDLETSRMRRPWPALGRSATGKQKYLYLLI